MLRIFLLPFLVSASTTYGIYLLLGESMSFPIADSLFVSSQLFFFYGLIRTTNATQFFESFSYTWRRMFFRKGLDELPSSYFEHKKIKDAEREERTGLSNPGPMYLIIGIALFIVSYSLYI